MDSRTRLIEDRKSFITGAHAKIDILKVRKEILVEKSNLVEDLTSCKKTAAGDEIAGTDRIERAVVRFSEAKMFSEPRIAVELPARKPHSARLIEIQNFCSDNSGLGILFHCLNHHFKGTRVDDCIVIEQQDIAAVGFKRTANAHVIPRRETKILGVANQMKVRMCCTKLRNRSIGGGVVDHNEVDITKGTCMQ